MPKKTRREKLRASRRPMNMPAAQPAPSAAPAAESLTTITRPMVDRPAAVRAPAAITSQTFDYTYVYRDLRRILLLALTFFIILIALSFVIH